MTNHKSIIESLLFVSGEPVALKNIARLLDISADEVEKSVEDLSKEYKENRGLKILNKDGEVQLVTSPENSEFVAKFMKRDMEQDLSRAALETLSIIAYRGPISRPAIEEIRGVNSSFSLRNLLLRGLIERVDNQKDKRSFLYKISFDFLKLLGVQKNEDLPDYENLNNIIQDTQK